MKLYLIRHGETVDNVAGLYAGVRDSTLTNHGVEQARRLGEHFAEHAIKAAQLSSKTKAQSPADELTSDIEIVCVSELIEQDFGFYEGKSFQARTDAKKTGKEAHREKHKDDPGFVDVESKDSLNKRADTFLDQHLLPLLREGHESGHGAIAIVSHGILLSHLWRRLLLRLPPKSVTVAPDIIASKGSIILQHLGGWSNTGYLQLLLSPEEGGSFSERESTSLPTSSIQPIANDVAGEKGKVTPRENGKNVGPVSPGPEMLVGWSTLIVGIDKKDHLLGLKRQRGGIGRSAHDEGQQKLTGFFKRHRAS